MNIVSQRPDYWTTWNGEVKSPNEIDQQHLSNIYWYHTIFGGTRHTWALTELKKRFNGQLLPYQPHIDFDLEIRSLEQSGKLQWMPSQPGDVIVVGVIYHNGKLIGGISKPLDVAEDTVTQA